MNAMRKRFSVECYKHFTKEKSHIRITYTYVVALAAITDPHIFGNLTITKHSNGIQEVACSTCISSLSSHLYVDLAISPDEQKGISNVINCSIEEAIGDDTIPCNEYETETLMSVFACDKDETR